MLAVIVSIGAIITYKYLDGKHTEQINIELAKKAEEERKAKKLEEKMKLKELRESNGIDGIAAFNAEKYAAVIADDEKSLLVDYEKNMMEAQDVEEFEKLKAEFDELVAQLDVRLDEWNAEQQRIKEEEERKAIEAEEQKQAQQQTQQYPQYSSGNSVGLTASSGVNYHGNRKETYYSSRVLYHYRTPEWWVDGEGFYRTSEGYYVVAASDMAQGTVFQGSKGACQVLDSGCAAGITDYYVNW